MTATSPAMLPRQVAEPVYLHRGAIIFGGIVTAITIGLLIALLGS